jgi:cytochrome c oxidase cbb3-type subunit 3/ubiquinol-cytochrome c reductase cytochrome c subunit
MRAGVCALALSCALLASGCNSLPGKPAPGPEVPRPDSVLSPQVLFAQNCAGCHGVEGQNGPATPLASPVYQALVDDATLHRVISGGLPGSMMPAFAQSAGGELTDAQVDAIVHGIRANWKKGDALKIANLPPYADDGKGDAKAGEQVYANNCANCHGPAGGKVGEAGSVLNPDFLTLMAPQTFRTTVIVGRPDLGMPDWREQMDSPMTAQQVSDVVAFLMVQKPNAPAGSTQGLQATQGATHQPAHQPKMSGGVR